MTSIWNSSSSAQVERFVADHHRDHYRSRQAPIWPYFPSRAKKWGELLSLEETADQNKWFAWGGHFSPSLFVTDCKEGSCRRQLKEWYSLLTAESMNARALPLLSFFANVRHTAFLLHPRLIERIRHLSLFLCVNVSAVEKFYMSLLRESKMAKRLLPKVFQLLRDSIEGSNSSSSHRLKCDQVAIMTSPSPLKSLMLSGPFRTMWNSPEREKI